MYSKCLEQSKCPMTTAMILMVGYDGDRCSLRCQHLAHSLGIVRHSAPIAPSSPCGLILTHGVEIGHPEQKPGSLTPPPWLGQRQEVRSERIPGS